MKPVVAQFIGDIKNQKQAECNANGQSQYIEQTIPFVFLKIANRNQQQVFNHV